MVFKIGEVGMDGTGQFTPSNSKRGGWAFGTLRACARYSCAGAVVRIGGGAMPGGQAHGMASFND